MKRRPLVSMLLVLFATAVSANAGFIHRVSCRMTATHLSSGQVHTDWCSFDNPIFDPYPSPAWWELSYAGFTIDDTNIPVDAGVLGAVYPRYLYLEAKATTYRGPQPQDPDFDYSVSAEIVAEAAFSGSVWVWGPSRSGYAEVTATGELFSCSGPRSGVENPGYLACWPRPLGSKVTVTVGSSSGFGGYYRDGSLIHYSSGLVPVKFGGGASIPIGADLKVPAFEFGSFELLPDDTELTSGNLSFAVSLYDENGAPLENFTYFAPFPVNGGTLGTPEPPPVILIAIGGVLICLVSRCPYPAFSHRITAFYE